MECKRCKAELAEGTTTIKTSFSSHDKDKIEVTVDCKVCGARYYGFLDLDVMCFDE